MRWAKSEYMLKGVFLGLLLFISMQKELDWTGTGRVALWLVGGFGAALLVALTRQLKEITGLLRNPVGFMLFLLLENPFLIYLGLIVGLIGGAIQERDPLPPDVEGNPLLIYCACGGALLGYILGELRQMTNNLYRLGLAAFVCAGVVAGIFFWLQETNVLADETHRVLLGVHLLLGIPFFYVLVFCGMAEESEVEIAALCATLGLGLYLAKFPERMPAAGLLVPVGLYCVYTIRILKPLRVFKHTLRGYGHNEIGHIRSALASFNRALQLDPRNQLARSGLVRLHRSIRVNELDEATRKLLNPSLCVSEAAKTLVGGAAPSAELLKEATRFLDFVAQEWPTYKANTDYYRVVADTHGKNLSAANERLNNLLDPTAWPTGDRFREAILFDAWQLALRTHPELKRGAGEVQLALPGRRMEALRAIERQLVALPNEASIAEFREELFAGLTEHEYATAAAEGPPADFGYGYAQEAGLKLLAEPATWQRGALLVRIAAHGLGEQAVGLFQKIAEVAEKQSDFAEARRARQRARESGLAFGVMNLPAEQRTSYFQMVKKLADEAAAAQDWKEAIANYAAYLQSDINPKETLRTLAQMYENDGQVLAALRSTEDALIRGADKDLNDRKDRYYYSVDPAELKPKADVVRGYFDVKYCVKKAKALLDSNSPELDVLDWASHLCQVALVMEPKNLVALVQMARCHLRRGERDDGLRILEDVRELKPSGGDEREAHEWTTRQLGLLYLEAYNRPDLAVECFKAFMESEKSGARTLYDLGRAYEALGEQPRALMYYQQAANFEDNPVRWDAEEAIRRLKG